jgi:leader peptidase (prepilin peptidase) / N-methyltransferase
MMVHMYIGSYVIYLALTLIGLCLGSFAGASLWRLRAHQLMQDEKNGDEVNKDEYDSLKKLTKNSILKDRSRCLHCDYVLRWYDLIPIFSWLTLRGRCRKCHTPIGWFELLIEIGVAAFFVISYVLWPYPLSSVFEIVRLGLWLAAGAALSISFMYDKKWYILPNLVSYIVIGLGAINSLLLVLTAPDKINTLFSIVGSALILSGLYFVLYLVSRGKWIGFGDIKLGLGLALLLADWKLAFIALFAANLIGCIVVLPKLIVGKLKRNSHVPFGPLLIVGTILAGLVGNYLVNLYFFSL